MPSTASVIIIVGGAIALSAAVLTITLLAATEGLDCFPLQQVDTEGYFTDEVALDPPWAWACHPGGGGGDAELENLCQILHLNQTTQTWSTHTLQRSSPSPPGRNRGLRLTMSGECASFLETTTTTTTTTTISADWTVRTWCYNQTLGQWEDVWSASLPAGWTAVSLSMHGNYTAVSILRVDSRRVRVYRRASPSLWVVDLDWVEWATHNSSIVESMDLGESLLAITCTTCTSAEVWRRDGAGVWSNTTLSMQPTAAVIDQVAVSGNDRLLLSGRSNSSAAFSLTSAYTGCAMGACQLQATADLGEVVHHERLVYSYPWFAMRTARNGSGLLTVYEGVEPPVKRFISSSEPSATARLAIDPASPPLWVLPGAGSTAHIYSLEVGSVDACGVCGGDGCLCSCGNGIIEPQCGEQCERADVCCDEQCQFRNSSFVCRESAGDAACDPVDFCSGTDSTCAADYTEAVGANCSSGLYCGGVATCDAQYRCVVTAPPLLDCAAGNYSECTVGVCDEQARACTIQNVEDGSVCVSALLSPGQCAVLGCVNGTCAAIPLLVGTGCDADQNPDTPDACDGQGACTPDLSLSGKVAVVLCA